MRWGRGIGVVVLPVVAPVVLPVVPPVVPAGRRRMGWCRVGLREEGLGVVGRMAGLGVDSLMVGVGCMGVAGLRREIVVLEMGRNLDPSTVVEQRLGRIGGGAGPEAGIVLMVRCRSNLNCR